MKEAWGAESQTTSTTQLKVHKKRRKGSKKRCVLGSVASSRKKLLLARRIQEHTIYCKSGGISGNSEIRSLSFNIGGFRYVEEKVEQTTAAATWSVSSTSQWQYPNQRVIQNAVELMQLDSFVSCKVRVRGSCWEKWRETRLVSEQWCLQFFSNEDRSC